MTSYSSHKRKIRELAEREGISYADARRRLAQSMTDFLDLAEQMFDAQKTATDAALAQHYRELGIRFDPSEATCKDRTLDVPRPAGALRIFRIQLATDTNHKKPYPYFVGEHRLVFNQSLWNGDPLLLHGFADIGPAEDELAHAQGRPSGRLALTFEKFLDDPEAALGLAPVFNDRDGKLSIISIPVEHIEVDWAMTTTSASDGVVSIGTSDDVAHATVPIGQLLPLLPRDVTGQILAAAEKNPGRSVVMHGDPVGWEGKRSAADVILSVIRIGTRFDALTGLPPHRLVSMDRIDAHLDRLAEESDYLDAEDIWDKMRAFVVSDTRDIVEPLVAQGTDPLVFVLDSLRDEVRIDLYERKRIDQAMAEQGLVWPTITFDAEAIEGVRRAASAHMGVYRLDMRTPVELPADAQPSHR